MSGERGPRQTEGPCGKCNDTGIERQVKRPKVYDMPPGMNEDNIAWHCARWDVVDVDEQRGEDGELWAQTLTLSRSCPDCQGLRHVEPAP